jgi:hypothetical protein
MAGHVDEHVVVFVPDHEDRAKDLLLWQDRGKPRLEALVASFGAGAQGAEALSWATIVGASTLAGAKGVNLDRWGALVGEHRGGLDNEQYRTSIELRQLVNTSFPNEDNVWTVISTSVQPYPVRMFELYPAGMKAIVYSTDALSESLRAHLVGLIRDFRPAGVVLPIIETLPGHFAFDWEADAPLFPSLAVPTPLPFSDLIYSGRGPG